MINELKLNQETPSFKNYQIRIAKCKFDRKSLVVAW